MFTNGIRLDGKNAKRSCESILGKRGREVNLNSSNVTETTLTCSFRNECYKNATELSKYIWSLKERKINYKIKWRKVKQARSYSNINKKCNFCPWEKYFIICKPEMSTLNHRNEMASSCRHSKKFLLSTAFT